MLDWAFFNEHQNLGGNFGLRYDYIYKTIGI